jgi:hypothetical protein
VKHPSIILRLDKKKKYCYYFSGSHVNNWKAIMPDLMWLMEEEIQQ